jgi:uncharacterized protein (TIGR02246 family)
MGDVLFADRRAETIMDQSVEALTAIPRRMVEAWNRGDAEGFFADFATDARLVEFEGTVLHGRGRMLAAQQPLFETLLEGSRLVNSEVLFAEIVAPGVGVVHHRAAMLMAGEQKPQPTRTSMQTHVVHWRDERWQIVVLQNARVISLEDAGRLDAAGQA